MMEMLRLGLLENEGEHGRCSHEDLAELSQVSRKMHMHANKMQPSVQTIDEEKVTFPNSNDVIYRGHLKPDTSVSGIVVAPRLQ